MLQSAARWGEVWFQHHRAVREGGNAVLGREVLPGETRLDLGSQVLPGERNYGLGNKVLSKKGKFSIGQQSAARGSWSWAASCCFGRVSVRAAKYWSGRRNGSINLGKSGRSIYRNIAKMNKISAL